MQTRYRISKSFFWTTFASVNMTFELIQEIWFYYLFHFEIIWKELHSCVIYSQNAIIAML